MPGNLQERKGLKQFGLNSIQRSMDLERRVCNDRRSRTWERGKLLGIRGRFCHVIYSQLKALAENGTSVGWWQAREAGILGMRGWRLSSRKFWMSQNGGSRTTKGLKWKLGVSPVWFMIRCMVYSPIICHHIPYHKPHWVSPIFPWNAGSSAEEEEEGQFLM